ncbi:MAG: tetratricopeptide repeat protein [Burkholderiaceae bacterium]|nr:tetratricopeptide repeat protein [Burkholderiaceae bacterium]
MTAAIPAATTAPITAPLATPVGDRASRLESYLAADPGNYPLLCDLAGLYLETDDKARARPLLERALQARADDPQAMYQMAVLDFFEHRPQESLARTHTLLAAGLADPVVQYQHACTLEQLGRHEEAEPLFKALLDAQQLTPAAVDLPGLPGLYVRSLHFQDKLAEAEAFVQACLARAPDDTAMKGMLSLLYLDQDKNEEALALAGHVLQTQPDNRDALVAKATALLAFEDAEAAGKVFEHAVAVAPVNGRAWLGWGLSDMMRGDLIPAQHRLRTALTHMPDNLGAWNTLAWTQILQEDLDGASATLAECLQANENFGETWGSMAVVAALRQQWDEAAELSKKAIRLQPETFAGRFAQSLLAEHRGRPERASALMQAMLNQVKVPGGGTLADMARRVASRPRSK